MFKLKVNKAFTLIELLVAITILTIIILGASSLDYNRLSMDQKLEIFTNDIKSDFERIRNNSLSWKWILSWATLEIPKKWTIDYSTSNSWTIISKYYNWTDEIIFNNTIFPPKYYIFEVNCLELNWTPWVNSPLTLAETGSIIFEWSNITLDWSCDSSTKILELNIKNNTDSKNIQINTLNWLVQIK